jgi:hypothetical protein
MNRGRKMVRGMIITRIAMAMYSVVRAAVVIVANPLESALTTITIL